MSISRPLDRRLVVNDTFRCGGCGREYGIDAWRSLTAIRTMSQRELCPYVVAWPTGRSVEVRTCRTCGRAIARVRP
jgi:hypothetical protein